jgi:signal transduction histidine kinase
MSEVHLLQLFENLISNALQYRGPEAPHVEIGAQDQGSEWLFCVKDNGTGIEPQYHEQIFTMFKPLHGVGHSGTGMGLSICQKIVERYGGRIWVESEPGRGAKFYFRLPASA